MKNTSIVFLMIIIVSTSNFIAAAASKLDTTPSQTTEKGAPLTNSSSQTTNENIQHAAKAAAIGFSTGALITIPEEIVGGPSVLFTWLTEIRIRNELVKSMPCNQQLAHDAAWWGSWVGYGMFKALFALGPATIWQYLGFGSVPPVPPAGSPPPPYSAA